MSDEVSEEASENILTIPIGRDRKTGKRKYLTLRYHRRPDEEIEKNYSKYKRYTKCISCSYYFRRLDKDIAVCDQCHETFERRSSTRHKEETNEGCPDCQEYTIVERCKEYMKQ